MKRRREAHSAVPPAVSAETECRRDCAGLVIFVASCPSPSPCSRSPPASSRSVAVAPHPSRQVGVTRRRPADTKPRKRAMAHWRLYYRRSSSAAAAVRRFRPIHSFSRTAPPRKRRCVLHPWRWCPLHHPSPQRRSLLFGWDGGGTGESGRLAASARRVHPLPPMPASRRRGAPPTTDGRGGDGGRSGSHSPRPVAAERLSRSPTAARLSRPRRSGTEESRGAAGRPHSRVPPPPSPPPAQHHGARLVGPGTHNPTPLPCSCPQHRAARVLVRRRQAGPPRGVADGGCAPQACACRRASSAPPPGGASA